jgi:hypothetical protein
MRFVGSGDTLDGYDNNDESLSPAYYCFIARIVTKHVRNSGASSGQGNRGGAGGQLSHFSVMGAGNRALFNVKCSSAREWFGGLISFAYALFWFHGTVFY